MQIPGRSHKPGSDVCRNKEESCASSELSSFSLSWPPVRPDQFWQRRRPVRSRLPRPRLAFTSTPGLRCHMRTSLRRASTTTPESRYLARLSLPRLGSTTTCERPDVQVSPERAAGPHGWTRLMAAGRPGSHQASTYPSFRSLQNKHTISEVNRREQAYARESLGEKFSKFLQRQLCRGSGSARRQDWCP